MKWIKLFTEILMDPKMGRLTDRQHRICINLFLLAGQQERDGLIGPLPDIAWQLHVAEKDLADDLAALSAVGIVDQQGEQWRVRQFMQRQERPPSDASEAVTERSRQHRQRQRNADATPTQRDGNALEQNRTEQTREEENRQDVAALKEEPLPPQPGDDQPTLSVSPTLAAKLDILREFGIPPSQGYELAERNSLANIQNWIAHLQNAPNVKNPAGLLVTRLRESVTAPLPGGNHGTADTTRRGRRTAPSDAEWEKLAREYNGKPGPSPGMLAV